MLRCYVRAVFGSQEVLEQNLEAIWQVGGIYGVKTKNLVGLISDLEHSSRSKTVYL